MMSSPLMRVIKHSNKFLNKKIKSDNLYDFVNEKIKQRNNLTKKTLAMAFFEARLELSYHEKIEYLINFIISQKRIHNKKYKKSENITILVKQ